MRAGVASGSPVEPGLGCARRCPRINQEVSKYPAERFFRCDVHPKDHKTTQKSALQNLGGEMGTAVVHPEWPLDSIFGVLRSPFVHPHTALKCDQSYELGE